MKKTLAVLLALVIACLAFAACGNKAEEAPKYDYMVLVNKQNKLPDDWESVVELEDAQNTLPEGIELNENNDYLSTDVFKVEKKALAAFRALQSDLEKDGIIILLDSTYRPVSRQEELWKEFEEEYGLEYTQKYVAVPGYSEHHTALAIDVCIIKDGVIINDNDQMTAEKEIFAEIHKRLADYGFILRYPEGKDDITGYGYEPWHFRYIDSAETAHKIMDEGLTLEEYLGKVPETTEAPKTTQAPETTAAPESTAVPETNAAAGNAAKEIVGTWESKDIPNMNFVYIFNEDGTGSYAGAPMTYTIDGNKISILYDGSVPFNSTFEIKGDELIILDSLGEDTVYVRK